jgi:hypothetical protein
MRSEWVVDGYLRYRAEETAPGAVEAAFAANVTSHREVGKVILPLVACFGRIARATGSSDVDPTVLTALLRCIFGNPFRPAPSLAPAVLAWNGGTVPKLAAAIYEERAFDRLPILADALEDAGCTDADILGHCRGGGEHVRDCWVVDLVLGKA